MYKIHKCIPFGRMIPRGSFARYATGKEINCPPHYDCKRLTEYDPEAEIEDLRKLQAHPLFEKKCHKDGKIYKRIFYFVCVPMLICVYINNFYFSTEEKKRPRFVEFSYLRIRNKEFPWDPVHTLFHNPDLNALPTGYETEFPEEMEYDPFDVGPNQ